MFHKNGPSLFELIQQSLVSTQAGYDMLAPKFDQTPFRTPDDLVRAAVAAAGHVECALDLCCGTGVAMEAMAPLTARRLVGIDFSSGMLAEAARALQNANDISDQLTIEFVQEDVMQMRFKEEFDLAVCFGALGHILPSDEREFVRRVHDALKPGGVFLFVTGTHPSIFSPLAAILRIFNAIMKIRNYIRKPEFVMYYLTFLLPEIEAKLREAGFRVEVYRELFPAPYKACCLVMATRTDGR